ncbi:hypothetical protein FGIG_08407 [Fasciola gigantica]|uniref:Uncharacterized protein n=1 Tax=Fasciola gigantica TaxID=46835 RepID=A0A504Z138_FASGI|nr:hypothetical protein FGIG_08407 [Fasciola gigantica]
MNGVCVHRIQCYDYHPSAFTCLARSPSDGLIATGRADGAVEVYDERRNFVLIARFPAGLLKSVESLGWSRKRRLFCSGALGRIHELELHTCSVKQSALLTGSSVSRCLFVADSHILVGNDEGFITLFSTDDSSLSQLLTFPQLNGKILALAVANETFDSISGKSNLLAAASTDRGTLVTLSYKEKQSAAVRHVLLAESVSTIVWSLIFVRNVLFSGDNCGNVCVWDPRTGGLVQTFPSHVGLVLTLTAADDSLTVFSGGSDAMVRKYVHISLDSAEHRWQLSGTLRGCRRDIRGLAYLPGLFYDPETEEHNSDRRFEPHRLLAVGLDSRLQLLSCTQSESSQMGSAKAHKTLASQVGCLRDTSKNAVIAHVAALPFWPWSIASGCIQPAQYAMDVSQPSRGWCLLHYPDRLIVMRLAELPCDTNPFPEATTGNTSVIRPTRGPLQLAEIRPKHGTEVICCAMTIVCGPFIAYSDLSRTCVLKLSCAKSNPKDETKTKVRVERITWKRDANKQPRLGVGSTLPGGGLVTEHSVSPDTTSDTDTNEDEDYPDELTPAMVARYFALEDESQSASARRPGLDRKRRRESHASQSPVISHSSGSSASPPIASKPRGEWSTLPAAAFLKFTPDAVNLILVTRITNELTSVSLDTGLERWRLRPSQDETTPVAVHALAMSVQPIDTFGYLIAVGCSDGRIYVHGSTDGKILFTCPRLSSMSGHFPYPARLAFSSAPNSVVKMAVVYTNNQLTEWLLNPDVEGKLSDKKETDEVLANPETIGKSSLHGVLNPWLTQFWSVMGKEFSAAFGLIHSLTYVDRKIWLLATDRYVIRLRKGTYAPGDIRKRVVKAEKSHKTSCLSFSSAFESIVQVDALDRNELALVSIHSASIAQQLAAPLQRKLFGL